MATFMEKDVLIELISHILGLTSKTVEFENPDRLSLILKLQYEIEQYPNLQFY